jgi:transposase
MKTLTERVLEYSSREAHAWQQYLEATRDCGDANYREVESWAWRRLQRQLRPAHRAP